MCIIWWQKVWNLQYWRRKEEKVIYLGSDSCSGHALPKLWQHKCWVNTPHTFVLLPQMGSGVALEATASKVSEVLEAEEWHGWEGGGRHGLGEVDPTSHFCTSATNGQWCDLHQDPIISFQGHPVFPVSFHYFPRSPSMDLYQQNVNKSLRKSIDNWIAFSGEGLEKIFLLTVPPYCSIPNIGLPCSISLAGLVTMLGDRFGQKVKQVKICNVLKTLKWAH